MKKLEQEILNTMSKNPSNWKGIFYYNPHDPRIFVPKLQPMMGWTLNFASKYSYILMIAIFIIALGSFLFL